VGIWHFGHAAVGKASLHSDCRRLSFHSIGEIKATQIYREPIFVAPASRRQFF
jgi:hypothetical protein